MYPASISQSARISEYFWRLIHLFYVPRMAYSRTIAFDMDGVLVDSSTAVLVSLTKVFEYLKIPHNTESGSDLVGFGIRELVKKFSCRELENHELNRCIELYRQINDAIGPELTNVYPDIENVVSHLRDQFTLIVATSKLTNSAEILLEKLGLSRYFFGIFGQESDERTQTKFEILSLASKRVVGEKHAPKIIALVGDRIFDIDAASEFGIASVGVMWGYGSITELQKADFLANSPSDLLRIFSCGTN